MLAAGSPITVPAFNLLDEGLATAFGGTVTRSQLTPARWAKHLATPRSMYSKPNIDLAGKTLLPIVDEWMTAGKTLDDPGFVARYLTAMTHAFGPRLASPAMRLAQLVLVIDDTLGEDLRLDVRRAIGPASTYTEIAPLATADLSTFASLPNTSALLVIPRRALPHLVTHKVATADQVQAMERATQGGHGILYAIDRNSVATTYIVIADTPTIAKQQIERLAAAPALFTGLLE